VLSETYGGEAIKKSSVFEWFKSVHILKSQMKTLLITLLDIKGVVHFEFIPQGQTVNQAHYVEIWKWLHEAVCIKGPEDWPNNWILHLDNASAYKVLSVKQFVAQISKLLKWNPHPLPFIWL
jgi:hypothetical protein